jgi:hypothetical protein
MDGADGVGVVVEQGERALDEAALNNQLLLQLAHEGPLISCGIKSLAQSVPVIDMPSNADRTLLEEACLP